jgi:hypothetical protein
MQGLAETLRDANTASIDFLKTEVNTGLTFANIAHDSVNAEKSARNRAHARLAYDTVLRFIGRVSLTYAEAEHLAVKMDQLKHGLEELGELF